MKRPTIPVGNVSFVILLFLLFLLPLNVCAQENSVSPASLTENSRINITVSLTQIAIDAPSALPVQPKSQVTSIIPPANPENITVIPTMSYSIVQTLATSYAVSPATTEIFPAPTIIPPITASNQNLIPGKNPGLQNSSNLTPKDSNVQERVNDNEQVFITDSRTGQKYVKDRVIVRFNTKKNAGSSISQEKIRLAHAKMGAKVEKDFSIGGVAGLQLVQLPNGTDVQSAIMVYESNPDVLYAEPDYVRSILPDKTGPIIHDVNSATILSIPNDPYFSDNQWSFHNTGQTVGTPGADIDAPGAWNISTGSNSVIIAVIDTGVLYTHSDLSANIWNNTDEIPDDGIDNDHNDYIDDVRGWDFVNSDNDPNDDKDHGTHVSGTIGAVGNNSIGVAGVNWQVKIMPLKALNYLGSGYDSDLIAAILYANANGASVISNSWGGGSFSQGLKDAIDASPAVVVCAAGNSASNNDINPVYPASYNSTNIISVAATDHNDTLASFSSFGLSSVDLAAPGKNIWSTYLDGNYYSMSGTSMATPHVSGVAALVKAVNPRLSTMQIKNIILNNVDVKSSLSGKVNTSGRLNAYTAVLAAQSIGGPDKIGVYKDGAWYLDYNGNGTFETIDKVYSFGLPGWLSVVGDWNGDGKTEIGVYKDGMWYLDYNGDGAFDSGDSVYSFGLPGWLSVVGDWDGDGKTEIGVYKDGMWYLDYNGDGAFDSGDSVYSFGLPGWLSVVGDWDGDGKTEIGVYKDGSWYLDTNGDGAFGSGDSVYSFGQSGWISIVGKW
jgi:subtilisin family serine protease